MCILCGTPDPSHDMMLVRAAVLVGGTGFILAPRRWLADMKTRLLRKRRHARVRSEQDQWSSCDRSLEEHICQ